MLPGLGFLLNDLFNKIDASIDHAKNAGLQLEIEAGVQARRAIENAQVAYADSLNLTIDKIDASAAKVLSGLQTLVQDALSGQQKILLTIAGRAQQIANTLPLHNDRPQLTGISPRFVVNQDPIRLTFLGNFEHAPLPGYAPQLEFNGKKFNATQIETQRLEFSVPSADVFPGVALGAIKKLTYGQGVLETSWPGTLLGGKNTALFKLVVGAMPSSPGTTTLHYKTFKKVTVSREKQSENFHLDSCKEGHRREVYKWWGGDNDDHKDFEFRAEPTPGWRVKRGTSSNTSPLMRGDCSGPNFVRDDENVVIYKATTIHHGLGSSGIMDFCIKFTEECEVEEETEHHDDIDLKWGNSTTFIPANDWKPGWKLTFDTFDGHSYSYIGADTTSSEYLRIESQGPGFVIKIARSQNLGL